jgi:2-oxoglutarate dehydrogenase E1 component
MQAARSSAPLTGEWPEKPGAISEVDIRDATHKSIRAIQMVRAYRVIGHLAADLDPLKLNPKPPQPQLDPGFYGFHDADLDGPVFLDGVLGLQQATPRRMVDLLKRTYCGRIGYEFMHITDPEQKDWLQRRIEGPDKEISSPRKARRRSSTS